MKSMSFEKQVEIYSYTLTLLNLTLKVKFPCRLYLEHQGRALTSEVTPTSANKFIFNQEVALKNESDKKYLELVVQLLTEKGNKYVGGVVKLAESDLVASEGQCMAVPVSKCLDAEAVCELRVDMVATSRVLKKGSPKKAPLRSEYHPDANLLYSSMKPRPQEGETKSEFNFPISVARKERRDRSKEPLVVVNSVRRGFKGDESRIEREPVGSLAGGAPLSSLEFEVYKEGYNKLKEKYRKEAEAARSEMNKRLALQNNENNLKLQAMRYKLKAEELEKTLVEKASKIKELGETISNLQKKELDSKYLKEEVQNKSYTIKSLEETLKSLNRDNNELKALSAQRYQSEQEMVQNLRDEVDRAKKESQNRQSELARELKIKSDAISKLEYSLHNKCQELERAKCNIDDLDKSITNKTFEWEKVIQSEKSISIAKQNELKEKIADLQSQKSSFSDQISQLEQLLQDKKGEISKLEYDKKIVIQSNEVLQKENEDLRLLKEKYIQLSREHKVVGDQKAQIQKAKERETNIKNTQISDLNEKLKALTEFNKKSVKDLQQRLKANQLKLIQNQSQNQSLKNQQEKMKRQFESSTKENIDLKGQLKECRADVKAKQETILKLTNDLSNINSKNNQNEQSLKLELTRLKDEAQKLTKALADYKNKSLSDSEMISQLELTVKKIKLEIQFKQERALKDLNYSKQRLQSLEALKGDQDAQINTYVQNITDFKVNQKNLFDKIQKLELQAIKNRQNNEKLKKQVKILEEKLQNSESNQQNKAKQNLELQMTRQKLDKRIAEQQTQIGSLKNDLSKEMSQKKRHQKIGEILQSDILKAKQEQTKLSAIITEKDITQASLREEIKKEKQEYTKLGMRLNSLRKQFDKFKQTLVDNLNTVFSSIPDGLNGSNQSRLRSIVSDRSAAKENSEVLNLLISLGRQARQNMTKTVDQLKQSIRDNEKLNSDYSISINKSNTAEFEYSQGITQIQEEMAQLLQEKAKDQNKYEQEIFLLEGRIKEKDATISDLTEQVEEFDFLLKNTKSEYELYRQESYKKDSVKNKLVEELREQVQYQLAEIEVLDHNLEKYQQSLEASESQLGSCKEAIEKLTKEGEEAKQNIFKLEENIASLKKELKRANEKGEQLSMSVAHKEQDLRKSQQVLQEEERKAIQLREFLKVLMRQKEEIIKNELEQSEKVLELETNIQQMKHQLQALDQAYKASKLSEEELKETIKKLTKILKDQERTKQDEHARGNKLADRLKDKEKQISAKDDTIFKLEERLKKQSEKKTKDLKELEAQLDEVYQKQLTTDREASQKILALENIKERQTADIQKMTETLANTEETLFREKNKNEELREKMAATQKNLSESDGELKQLASRLQALNEELRVSEEETFKLQGKINLLQMKFDMRESEGNDRIQNLNEDWSSKYYSMEEEYEQRLELAEKERDFLKEKLAENDKEIKKLTADIRAQEVNFVNIKKSYDGKIKSLEEDRLAAMAEKNSENQRLVDEVRTSFDALKLKESECRKLQSELQLVKANLAKVEGKWREGEEKIRSLNRNYQAEAEEMRKKETNFKRLKETLTSSQWKAQREVRKVVQNSTRQIIDLVDQKNTIRVMEVSRALEQSVLAAITLKLDDKDI